ncbi:MAG: DUF2520 domain-containing protein [Candidatus Berkiella sp.]
MLIIGNGRMATHFSYYLSLLHIPFLQWSRKTHHLCQLPSLIQQATHIVLLISDSAIPTFLNNFKIENKIIIHFSGLLSIPGIYSAHPLMTFTHDLYKKECYQQIPFILEEGSLPIAKLLPKIPNQAYYIPSHLKDFYHALCVISNNFSCLLWQKLFQEIKNTFHLPQEIILPFLQQSFHNLQKNPHGSLTGPLARGDFNTINKHLLALKNDDFQDIYQAFVNYYKTQQRGIE